VRHLVLRRDIIDAVAQGNFHIYPVRTIDEGLDILTGIPSADGTGVESINQAAARRLEELAIGLKEFAALPYDGASELKG
jgi:ATP-dependent Lon protease